MDYRDITENHPVNCTALKLHRRDAHADVHATEKTGGSRRKVHPRNRGQTVHGRAAYTPIGRQTLCRLLPQDVADPDRKYFLHRQAFRLHQE